MIRISFNKIQFSQNTTASHVYLEVQTQTSETLKIKQKKIKNNISRFYGDFIELDNSNSNIWFKIYTIEPQKQQNLIEKLMIKRNTYGYSQKKSHVIQTMKIKITFDSQKLSDNDSFTDENTEQFSDVVGGVMFSPRLSLKKVIRGFSPDQRIFNKKMIFSQSSQQNKGSRNSSMIITLKSSLNDTLMVNK